MCTLLIALVLAAGPRDPAAGTSRRPATPTLETLPARGVTAEIRTPEGFIRLEGAARPTSGSGAFAVYPAASYSRAAPPPGSEDGAAGEATPQAPDEAAPPPTPDPCWRERNAYLRRLLRMDGIDLEDPLALLDGLSGPAGHANRLLFTAYGLLPGVDPIQPLAWDFELRSLARELTTCAAAARAAPR